MSSVVCPGSFDPVTNGHLDIFERSSKLFDRVVVAAGVNISKSGLFSLDERLEMLEKATVHLGNVEVVSFQGLLVDFCADQGIDAIVKGLRGVSDFDYELQMAHMNQHMTRVDTIFMATRPENSFLSSSLIREVAKGGRDVSALVPAHVHAKLTAKLA